MPDLAEAGPAGGSTAPKEFPKSLPLMERALPAEEIRLVKGDDGFTRITFPCSSETPVDRWYGEEVLSHEQSAIRMERIGKGACPLLFNHDMDDPIGMVTGARIERKRLVVDAKLFKTPRAAEIETMIDGGLRNVSLMYRIHVSEEDVKKQRYTHTDWEPYEVSVVTVPADATVGIGRAQEAGEQFEVRMVRASPDVNNPAKPAAITGVTKVADETAAAGANADQKQDREAFEKAEREAREKLDNRSTLDMEQSRVRAIENLAKANKVPENIRDAWVRQGYSLEQVSNDILKILEERGKSNPQPASRLGLTGQETQRFSLARAIVACKDQNWKDAGFELECSRAVAQKLGKVAEPTKFYVPFEVMERSVDPNALQAKRDLSVGTAGNGGYLVSTDNQGFIEILRNRSVAFRMGARRLSGLQGNVTVPRQSAAATAYWLGTEATQITESQQTFVQMALTPKTAGAYTEVSRLLLLQSSPAAEGIVTDDLAQVVAIAADLAVLSGSGSGGQPTGILNTSGIGSVTGTSIDYAKVLEFQTDVATANVTPLRGGYVTTPAIAALLMGRARFSNTDTPLWTGNIWDGQVSGFPAMSSNQMSSATMLFGDWQEAVVGEWGVLEVEVNPYANFQAGIIGVRAMYSLDVGVRRPFAFSSASSIT